MSQMPTFYPNVLPQTSQNNFQQQQQHNPQHFSPFNMNQQGTQNQTSQFHQGEYFGNQQVQNPYQQNQHLYPISNGMQNQNYGSLPQRFMDQFRSCMNSAAPIFILPNACPNSSPTNQIQPPSMMGQNMIYPMNYPQIGIPYSPSPTFCYPPSCIPYLPIPIYNNFSPQDRNREKSHNNCECSQKSHTMKETYKNSHIFNETDDHKCKDSGEDGTICSKKNCPSAINLQALASQFLTIRGIIPSIATRLVLRKIPGSNITTSVDDLICMAQRELNQLNKDQLITETRNIQQINALINLHMTANHQPNIIPILTMIQLKINLLKSQVESLLNKKLMENQGIGAEGAGNLDHLVLALKTNAELREFLAALREKECMERVNLNFAPYHAQRLIAEGHLNNIQNKISQVEGEMERRRKSSIPRTSITNWTQDQFLNSCSNFNNSTFVHPQLYSTSGIFPTKTFESPDPFIIQVRSPKRLNLKPHVGSPETTYERSKETRKNIENNNFRFSKQTIENENCPCETSSTSSTRNNLENEKNLQKKSIKSNSTINDNDNINQNSSSKLSICQKSINNNEEQESKKSCSIELNNFNPEVDNIPSKDLSEISEDKNCSDKECSEKNINSEEEENESFDADLKDNNSEENYNRKSHLNENIDNQRMRNISTVRIEISGSSEQINNNCTSDTSNSMDIEQDQEETGHPKKYISSLNIPASKQ